MKRVKTNQMTVAAAVIWPVSSCVVQMGTRMRSHWSDSMFHLYKFEGCLTVHLYHEIK